MIEHSKDIFTDTMKLISHSIMRVLCVKISFVNCIKESQVTQFCESLLLWKTLLRTFVGIQCSESEKADLSTSLKQ